MEKKKKEKKVFWGGEVWSTRYMETLEERFYVQRAFTALSETGQE